MSDKIRLTVGEQKLITITVKEGGSAKDLTVHAAVGVAAIKVYARTGDSATWDVINGVNIAAYTTAASGIVTFQITTTHTAAAMAGKAHWRMELNDGAGTPEIVWTDRGKFEIVPA